MTHPEDRDLWERDEATPSDFAAAGSSGARLADLVGQCVHCDSLTHETSEHPDS